MRSARINFGLPSSEYIVEVDNTGTAVSCKNQDTNTEYVGGGIPTYNIKIELYNTGTNELVDYTLLVLGYFLTDTQNDDYGFVYNYSNIAPGDHIYKAPVKGDNILFEGDREIIGAGDGQNSWIPDPNADLIRSVSGSAVKDDLNVIITGDCTITVNVIQD